jgi:hypothetical protein
MSATRKATSSKKKWQAVQTRYTWHLHPPFNNKFDHSQWWSGQVKPEPEAALYELARRHPLVNEIPPKEIPLPGVQLPTLPSFLEPKPSLRLTQHLGMKSWPKLTASERRNWKSSIGMMKGFDFRPIESLSIDITRQADLTIGQQRNAQIVLAKNIKGYCGFWGLYAEPTDREWEAAISQCAVEAHRQGYVLIAVMPNLATGKAGTAIVKQYREHHRLYPHPQPAQRARWQDWLTIISVFEKMISGKWDSQIFARYRRVLDDIRFT